MWIDSRRLSPRYARVGLQLLWLSKTRSSRQVLTSLLRCEQHWAFELYTNGVKPWLRDLQLDWCDADGGESTFSAGAHAEWLSDSTLAHLAVDIAAADTALLSCCLTLERYVIRRLHPAHECALAHIPQPFACKAPRCLALDEACEMPSGH